ARAGQVMRGRCRRAPSRAPALLVLVLAGTLGVAGCGGDAADANAGPAASPATDRPAYGDTLIEASIANISGLIPNVTSDQASHEVGSLIYTGLVMRDRDLNIVGDLAESWEFSKDCLNLTFRLRKNARWHDGKPFTADDVVFTWEAMVNPKTPTAYREDFLAVKSVAAPDPHTVRVAYTAPYAKALQSWEMWMLPRHLLQTYVQEGKLREAPQNRVSPVGTGPYRFQEWKSGEKVVLTENADYYAGRPRIARVVYRIIPSQATIFLELKAKGVDLASLTAMQYARQTEYPAFRKAYEKYRYPGNGYTYLGFNLEDKRFADKRVRHAFAHAINRRELIDGVIQGLGREATGPFKPGTWAHNPTVRTYPYDLARAKALLAEAGWKDTDGDGLLDKDSRAFTFELLTNQGNEERKRVAQIVQASLKDLGIGVEVRVLEWAAFIKEYIQKRRFEAIVLGWGIGQDPDQYAVWHSSQTGPDQLNHISFRHPEADALLEKGRSSCRQEERQPVYHRLHALLAEEQPLVFLYFRDALPVVASRVRGVAPSPGGIKYNFPEWYVPKHLQRYTAR
ncbi:MAG: peptide-binding protein, partial [Candidatus Rokuibacteriota bacterium]